MTTKASLKALLSPNNQQTRWTHRKIIYNALKGCELTYLEIAAKVRLKPEQVWKRASDLEHEDILIIVGQKEENGQPHSIYAQNPNPPNLDGKIPPFKEWVKENHPDIWHKYRALYHHEI